MLAVVTMCALPATTHAAPITLNFTGAWTFHDPLAQAQQFWTAMAAVGVTEGAALAWSIVIDDTAPDLNPDPTVGLYNAIVSSQMRIGALTLNSGPSTLYVDTGGAGFTWFGAMGSAVSGFLPQYLQLRPGAGTALPNDWLATALASIALGTNHSPSLLTLAFNLTCAPGGVCAQFQGHATLQPSPSSVPEPGSLIALSVGLLLLLAFRFRHPGTATSRASRS
jgi:hypothetical protein